MKKLTVLFLVAGVALVSACEQKQSAAALPPGSTDATDEVKDVGLGAERDDRELYAGEEDTAGAPEADPATEAGSADTGAEGASGNDAVAPEDDDVYGGGADDLQDDEYPPEEADYIE